MSKLDALPVALDSAVDPERVLSQLESLPTLSSIAVKLLQLVSDPECSVTDLVNLLRADQSLTAKILAVANSAASGARQPVTTLERAIVQLGFRAIRNLALAVKIFACFDGDTGRGARRSFDRAAFWKHALAVACAARRLAAARPELRIDPEDAFVGGLLHDLGKVALDAVYPKTYERIAAQSERTRGDIADGERSLLGIDHTLAGRKLAEHWGLPRALREVIWLHHLAAETLPASVSAPALVAVVQLADTLAREQRIGYSGNHTFYEPSGDIARRVGFTESTLSSAAQILVDDVARQAAMLGLDQETPQSMYFEALSQANGELGRANDELSARNRRLAAAARYFEAITSCDGKLTASADLSAVVAAITESAARALQRPCVAVFGVRDSGATVDLAWRGPDGARPHAATENLAPDFRAWLEQADRSADELVVRAPRAVRSLFAPALAHLGSGDAWLALIRHDGAVAGGILFLAEADATARFADQAEELRSFLASLGLAIGRANAHAAARRLSDDLADTNRRLQQMQLELLRTRTLSMIAEMAAGAGHELNSPLAVISGRAQMLHGRVEDPEMRRSLDQMREKAHECSRIVSELMDFAKPRAPRPVAVDLTDLLAAVRAECIEQLKLAPSRISLESSSALPPAWADREQMQTVFVELIRNATHATAMNDGGIVLRVEPAASGDALEITVADTGCGMNAYTLQRAFDPFFSHRDAGRGRGLGLPRAHRIIEAHGGRIWLESRAGEGTTAHVVVPAARRNDKASG